MDGNMPSGRTARDAVIEKQPPRFEQAISLGKVLGQMGTADMLKHAHTDNFIEGANATITIIQQLNNDPISQIGTSYLVVGKIDLLFAPSYA
jgi:hypothetical protein